MALNGTEENPSLSYFIDLYNGCQFGQTNGESGLAAFTSYTMAPEACASYAVPCRAQPHRPHYVSFDRSRYLEIDGMELAFTNIFLHLEGFPLCRRL